MLPKNGSGKVADEAAGVDGEVLVDGYCGEGGGRLGNICIDAVI